MDLKRLKELRLAFKEGRMGDVAVIKLDLFGFRLHPSAQRQLQGKTFSVEDDDLQALAKLPKGSLGQVYAHHMKLYDLKPFLISPEYKALAQKHSQGIRYIKTHDIFHVLTGFDTSLAGEIGVLYFTFAQKMYKFQAIAAVIALIFYPIIAPHKTAGIIHAAKKGWKMGKKATILLSVKFEELWSVPIEEVRRDLGIEVTD